MHYKQEGLKRGLKNRHIQLIALGGAIGANAFFSAPASVLQAAGPSMILGCAIGGIIAFMIMRQLGEMVAQEPVAGSFSHFAYKYWGDFPGFLSGWNYWVLYVLVGMAEPDGGRHVCPLLVAGCADVGIGARLLCRHHRDQSREREGVRRNRVLVRDRQGRGRDRHDPVRRLSAVFPATADRRRRSRISGATADFSRMVFMASSRCSRSSCFRSADWS